MDQILGEALKEFDAEIYEDMRTLWEDPLETCPSEFFRNKKIIFAIPLGKNGVNRGYYEVLAWLRTGKQVLEGSVAGFLIDADSELFTKAAARELAVAANEAGCAFPGRPLVEGTESLDNYIVQAANMNTDKMGAYIKSARILAEQLLEFCWEKREHPHLLVLHASNHKTSNTMQIWNEVRAKIEDQIEIREVNLRNGTLEDCAGCPFKMCLHFGERGQCFYGGAIQDEVYPGVKWADGILMLCPNYNDALSANMTAFINRLTALFRTQRFYDKAMFAIIVSGYSGSDLIAGQLVTALNMNKTFYMPGNFCMMETGNAPGSAMQSEGIHERINSFASQIISTLKC
ncbi:MAG: flavodoxin family protein [Lachnospiraceae bacterium]|nr:flavodoxin family protein [Lachnospiraceae bacterium]